MGLRVIASAIALVGSASLPPLLLTPQIQSSSSGAFPSSGAVDRLLPRRLLSLGSASDSSTLRILYNDGSTEMLDHSDALFGVRKGGGKRREAEREPKPTPLSRQPHSLEPHALSRVLPLVTTNLAGQPSRRQRDCAAVLPE